MTQFVVDANVAIKWVFAEIHQEAALKLVNGEYDLLVPDFFFPEITNILWKRVRRGEVTLDAAQADLADLMAANVEVCPSLPIMPQALEIAVRSQQAVYDCVYLALAATTQCQMVTADQRFYNALQADLLKVNLLWIEDLS